VPTPFEQRLCDAQADPAGSTGHDGCLRYCRIHKSNYAESRTESIRTKVSVEGIERKRGEERLRESEHSVRLFMEAIPQMLSIRFIQQSQSRHEIPEASS
jgi:hypothetical protein